MLRVSRVVMEPVASAGRLRRVNVFLAGPGLVGSTLLRQISKQQPFLRNRLGVDMRVGGVCDVTVRDGQLLERLVIEPAGIDLTANNAETSWGLENGRKGDVLQFVSEIEALGLPRSVFVDCTAADPIVKAYEPALSAGIHVVAANKKANSGPLETYKRLQELSNRPQGSKFMYECNVGAGLPVLQPLQNLVNSGDQVLEIQGILSGTLSYIFNTLSKDMPFSACVTKAKANGFTEPDPRNDLNASDVARKILILGRESGLNAEYSDVQIDFGELIPEPVLCQPTVEAFMAELPKADAGVEARRAAAEADGKVLRVLAKLDMLGAPKLTVSLDAVDKATHPAAHVKGAENIIIIKSARYRESPIVVVGPGAGAEVTAAGVFGDIIALSNAQMQ